MVYGWHGLFVPSRTYLLPILCLFSPVADTQSHKQALTHINSEHVDTFNLSFLWNAKCGKKNLINRTSWVEWSHLKRHYNFSLHRTTLETSKSTLAPTVPWKSVKSWLEINMAGFPHYAKFSYILGCRLFLS